MITKHQVDAMVSAIKAKDLARVQLYGDSISELNIEEFVPNVTKLREIATALNMPTNKSNGYVTTESVDYCGVHFFAPTGEVM